MSSLEDKANSLQPTCEEYYSDDALPARDGVAVERDVRPEAPIPPTAQPLPTVPPFNYSTRVPSNGSDSGYSSRTAATLNSLDSAKAFLPNIDTVNRNTAKPIQAPTTKPIDVPQKSKDSPPTSYKQAPLARSRSISKAKKEGSMRGQYRPRPAPPGYIAPRPGLPALQTATIPAYSYASVPQPTYVATYTQTFPVEVTPVSWSAAPILPARRRSYAQRPASVGYLPNFEPQWVDPSPPSIPQAQSYSLVDLDAALGASYGEPQSLPKQSRRRHRSRDTSRRRLIEEPSSSRSKGSSVRGGALVSYGSNPVESATSSKHRSKSKERRKKGKMREREHELRSGSSDDEFDQAVVSPKRDALVRTTSRKESTSSSRPTFDRLRSSYHEDSYRSSREPKRAILDKPSRRRDVSTTPAVISQTTVQRTTSRRESTSHHRTRSNDPVMEETKDKIREAEKHMQKSSASRSASDVRKQVIATSAQPVVSISHEIGQTSRNARQPSETGSHRKAVPSVADSSRTAASQSRTDAGGSVKFAHDPTKPLYVDGDIDLHLRGGMAELSVGSARGREQQYGGSTRSGGSFAERSSRR